MVGRFCLAIRAADVGLDCVTACMNKGIYPASVAKRLRGANGVSSKCWERETDHDMVI